MIDQHLHSLFSYDSNEEIENYLRISTDPILTTEHLDLENPVTRRDDIPDFEKYFSEIARLQSRYENEILAGVEIGYLEKQKDQVLEILSPFEFDLLLLSVHQNGKFDYMDQIVLEYPREEIYMDYLKRLIDAVKNYSFCNVLTHIDYGIRLFGSKDLELELFDELFVQLIDALINSNMSVELNTRSMYQFKNRDIYEYFIKKYMASGGGEFTLGSDGHSVSYYKYHFKDAILFMKGLGIHEINIFKKRKKMKYQL